MNRLSSAESQALSAYYLAEIPQREMARQLGVTIGALEARLHRARSHLRRILCHDLRVEATDAGLSLEQEELLDWRETKLWCDLCGQRRLLACFRPCGEGLINFLLRCPDCWRRLGLDALQSNGIAHLAGLRSVRPALKRTMQSMIDHFSLALKTGHRMCSCCGARAAVRIVEPDEASFPLPQKFWLGSDCPGCGLLYWTLDDFICWPHPPLQQFLAQHPRRITEPDTLVTYEGQEAIRFRFRDLTSSACLTILVHRQTLQILATFHN